MSFKSEVNKFMKNKILIKDIDLSKISNKSGIYIVEYKGNKTPEFLNTTTAITKYTNTKKGKTINLLYPKSELEYKYSLCDKEILYVGKADDLNNRITDLIKYAYKKCKIHRGGRALWQIKNWENVLYIYWCEVDNAEQTEKYLLKLHSSEHPNKTKKLSYPFANWRL